MFIKAEPLTPPPAPRIPPTYTQKAALAGVPLKKKKFTKAEVNAEAGLARYLADCTPVPFRGTIPPFPAPKKIRKVAVSKEALVPQKGKVVAKNTASRQKKKAKLGQEMPSPSDDSRPSPPSCPTTGPPCEVVPPFSQKRKTTPQSTTRGGKKRTKVSLEVPVPFRESRSPLALGVTPNPSHETIPPTSSPPRATEAREPLVEGVVIFENIIDEAMHEATVEQGGIEMVDPERVFTESHANHPATVPSSGGLARSQRESSPDPFNLHETILRLIDCPSPISPLSPYLCNLTNPSFREDVSSNAVPLEGTTDITPIEDDIQQLEGPVEGDTGKGSSDIATHSATNEVLSSIPESSQQIEVGGDASEPHTKAPERSTSHFHALPGEEFFQMLSSACVKATKEQSETQQEDLEDEVRSFCSDFARALRRASSSEAIAKLKDQFLFRAEGIARLDGDISCLSAIFEQLDSFCLAWAWAEQDAIPRPPVEAIAAKEVELRDIRAKVDDKSSALSLTLGHLSSLRVDLTSLREEVNGNRKRKAALWKEFCQVRHQLSTQESLVALKEKEEAEGVEIAHHLEEEVAASQQEVTKAEETLPELKSSLVVSPEATQAVKEVGEQFTCLKESILTALSHL